MHFKNGHVVRAGGRLLPASEAGGMGGHPRFRQAVEEIAHMALRRAAGIQDTKSNRMFFHFLETATMCESMALAVYLCN